MGWVLAIVAGWVGIAAVLAVVISRGIRIADRRAVEWATPDDAPNIVMDPPGAGPGVATTTAPPAPVAPERPPTDRTRHPLPRVRLLPDESQPADPKHAGERSRRS
jgi:hypothetical protein